MTLPTLEALLRSEGADFELIRQDRPILTVQDAETYYPVEQSAPSFVLQANDGLVLCIASMRRGRLDFDAMKQAYGFTKLRMAAKERVERETGYPVGSIPLIGLELPCIFDDSLLCFDFIYGGSGDPLVTLKINPADVKRHYAQSGTLMEQSTIHTK